MVSESNRCGGRCGVRVTGVSESDTYGVRTWQVCVRKWQVWQKTLKMVNGLRGIF